MHAQAAGSVAVRDICAEAAPTSLRKQWGKRNEEGAPGKERSWRAITVEAHNEKVTETWVPTQHVRTKRKRNDEEKHQTKKAEDDTPKPEKAEDDTPKQQKDEDNKMDK